MNKYFRYSTAILLGGLFLGLSGCGSSNNNCPSGQVNSQFGCATTCGANAVTQPGTSSCVMNTLAAGNSVTCPSGLTPQTVPGGMNTMPQYNMPQYGNNQMCCPSGVNLSQYPQEVNYCQPAMPAGYSNGYNPSMPGMPGFGTATIGGPCPFPGYQGWIYEGGSSCAP